MTQLNWLLIGTGDIVKKRVAGALNGAEGSRIVGIVGHRQRAESLAKQHNIPQVYDDLNEALKQSDANAVYVATPVFRHNSEAIAAIESGRHVLVEKPLGLSGADAGAIADAAESKGVVVGCAYYRRCFPRYRQVHDMLAAGEFGKVVLVRTSYYGWFSPTADDPKHWRVEKKLSGGGPLADMGSHMFDLIIGWFGLPASVSARCDTLANTYEVEDSSVALMTLSNGAQVLASFGWNSKTWTHELEIVGSEGRVRWSPADSGPVAKTVGRDTQQLDLPSADNVHLPLVQDFGQAVRDRREPICPLREAAKTNRLLDAMYESSRLRREVTL